MLDVWKCKSTFIEISYTKLRTFPWVTVPAPPFFIGRPGSVRSRAWIWLFSSTQRTSAFVRRIEKKSDHVFNLRGEVLVARDLERLDKMRLQPCARQIRWTLLWNAGRDTAPAPMGRVRRFLRSVMCTTCLIFSGASGLTREGLVACFKSPSAPSAT